MYKCAWLRSIRFDTVFNFPWRFQRSLLSLTLAF